MAFEKTDNQVKILVYVTRVSAALSVMGSGFIVTSMLRHRKKKLRRTYHRLLLGMSIADLWASIWYFISGWALPADEAPSAYNAKGNRATCAAQGFSIQLVVTVPVYNLALCLYYMLTVSYRWKKAQLVTFEKYMHCLAWLFGTGTAIAGLPLKLYNSLGSICYIGAYPLFCVSDDSVECARGADADMYRLAFRTIPAWCCAVIDVIALFKVYHTVKTQENVSRRWRRGSGVFGKESLKKDVLHQALFFFFAFLVTWLPPTITNFILVVKEDSPYWIIVLTMAAAPLQGLWNFLIYIRPRYIRYRRRSIPTTVHTQVPGVRNVLSVRLAVKHRLFCCQSKVNEDVTRSPTLPITREPNNVHSTNDQMPEEGQIDSEEGEWDPSVIISDSDTHCDTSENARDAAQSSL